MAGIVILLCCGPAAAFGFGIGGGGREYSYPNDPQYQYPGKEMRKCPKDYAPYKGACRKLRWLRRIERVEEKAAAAAVCTENSIQLSGLMESSIVGR